jgi:beta-lactamase regulating signal transducer with metallopeptidase domain/protocatechuate 3,4-dioxygenase beta subunit
MINSINQFAEGWFNWQISMLWQVAILICIVAIADLILRRWAWPQVRYALWLLILVKLILPPAITSPTSFTAEIPFVVKQTLTENIEHRTQNLEEIRNSNLQIRNKFELSKYEIQKSEEFASPMARNETDSPATGAGAKQAIAWKVYLMGTWIFGVLVLSVWVIARLRNLRREHFKTKAKLPENLLNILESAAKQLNLKRIPEISLSEKVCCPAVFGVFRPVLLIPSDKFDNISEQDAENIFLHELAHIKRGDLLVHAFYMCLQIAYWFNPLLWLIRKHIQNLRELCCDATVARILRERTATYRQTLLETARKLIAEPADPGMGLLGLFENSGRLIDRLRWLEKKSWKYRPLRIATVFILICLMSACVLPMAKFKPEANFIIKGTVIDSNTGKPIAAALVGDVNEYAKGEFFTITDANGNYSYQTYYEEHGVKASAEGYKEQRETLLTKIFGSEKEKVINFNLKRGKAGNNIPVNVCGYIDPSREDMQILTGTDGPQGTIAGKVVDANGNPLKDVTVDIWHWYKGNETKTDANGYFYLGGFEPEQKTVEITFRKKNFTPKYLIRQPLGIKDAVVVLGNKTYFEGIVTEPNGSPVSGADIAANAGPKDCEGVRVTEVATKCKSDKDGHYKLYVQTDTYDIQVKSKQGVIRLQNVEIKKDQAKKLDMVLDNGVIFLAKVLNAETNEPVQGVTFMNWQHKDVKGVSDSNGIVRIPNMMPGKFEFDVKSNEYCRWWSDDCLSEWNRKTVDDRKTNWQRNFDGLDFDLKNNARLVTVFVEKGVKIRGKVIDPQGNLVAGATATLARTGSGNSLTGDTRFSFTTDANGTFEMLVPASKLAKYNLIAHDGKFEEWRKWANGVLEPIQTQPGQIIENVVIKLNEPAVVKGSVVDTSGKPSANHQVRTSAFDKLENRYYDLTVRTDANGNFELKFVRPGKQYIQADPFWLDANQAPEGTSQIVTVEAGQTLEGVKLLALTSEEQQAVKTTSKIEQQKVNTDKKKKSEGKIKISGIVLDVNGRPIADVNVEALWDVVCDMVMLGVGKTLTDEQGRWSINVPDNLQEIRIKYEHKDYILKDLYGIRLSSFNKDYLVKLEKGAALAGKVVDDNGDPIPNAVLIPPEGSTSVSAENGLIISPTTVKTDEKGNFVLSALKRGKNKIVVDANGYSAKLLTVNTDNDFKPVKIILDKGKNITGIVKDPNGKPVEGAIIKSDDWNVLRICDSNEKYCSPYEQYQILRLKALTDSNGIFTIKNAPEIGILKIFAGTKFQYLGYIEDVNLSENKTIEITLYKEPIISGNVIDEQTGEPIKEFSLTRGVKWADSNYISWLIESKKVLSNDGRFEATLDHFTINRNLPYGALKINAEGYLPEAILKRVDEKSEPVTLKLKKGKLITGQIVSRSGNPIESAEVAIVEGDRSAYIRGFSYEMMFSNGPENIVKTSAAGEFKFPPIQNEAYIIALHKDGWGIKKIDANSTSNKIILTPWAVIRGHINNFADKDKSVKLWDASDGKDFNGHVRWFKSVACDINGKFSFEYIPSLKMKLACETIPERNRIETDTFMLEPGKEYELIIDGNKPVWKPEPKIFKAAENPRSLSGAGSENTEDVNNDQKSKEANDVNESLNEVFTLIGQIAGQSAELEKLKMKNAPQADIDKVEKDIEQKKMQLEDVGRNLGENAKTTGAAMAEKVLSKLQEFIQNKSLPLSKEVQEEIQDALKDVQEAIDANQAEKSQGIDIYVEDFKIQPYEAGGLYTLEAKIGNKGTETAPAFRMNFYKGDPKDNLNLFGKPQTGSHGAGPIKPGEFWNESSQPFALNEGTTMFFVVLDFDNKVAESNENNNQAILAVDVNDGKINKKLIGQSVIISRFPDGYKSLTISKARMEERNGTTIMTSVKVSYDSDKEICEAIGESNITIEKKCAEEQKDILEKALQSVKMKYDIGEANSAEVMDAQINLLRLEEKMAETPQQKITVLEEIVSLYKKQEKEMQTLIAAGRAGENDLNNVKLKRLQAEEELALTKANQNIAVYTEYFEITKESFLPGDFIEITEITGSKSNIEPGETYTIKGKYNLSSRDDALLYIYCTNGETESQQGPIVKRGSGEFVRKFKYLKKGWLHLSFYPAEGGTGFGELYFAQKGSKEKVPEWRKCYSDVYIKDFTIQPYQAGGLYTLQVKIVNAGSVDVPWFRMNFYKGKPEDNVNLFGKPITGSYGAGPIKADEYQIAQSQPFALNNGENEFTAVLDIDNAIAETNENNNSASLKIFFENGRIKTEKQTDVINREDLNINLPPDLKAYDDWSETNFKEFLDCRQYDHSADEENLINQLNSDKSKEYYKAINALACIKSKKAIPSLAAIAFTKQQKNNRDRWMATRAFGIIGDKAVIGDLIHLMYHYNSNTRIYARISLIRLVGKDYGPNWEKWALWYKKKVNKNFSTRKIHWTDDKELADEKKQRVKDDEWLRKLQDMREIKGKYSQ